MPELSGAQVVGPLAHVHVHLPVVAGLAVHVPQNPLVPVPAKQPLICKNVPCCSVPFYLKRRILRDAKRLVFSFASPFTA